MAVRVVLPGCSVAGFKHTRGNPTAPPHPSPTPPTHLPLPPTNPTQVLHAAGFLYDSTLIDDPLGDSLSRGMAARLWPYGMQDGIPQNCDE